MIQAQETDVGEVSVFAKAYALASEFTQPVIISTRLHDGKVDCGVAAFVVLNPDGWILTAAHLWDSFVAHKAHLKELERYDTAVQGIETDTALTARQKTKKLGELKSNPQWIVNHSFWWGWDRVREKGSCARRDLDLAVARLEPFDPAMVKAYPTIKDPSKNMHPGTSLCRLGYPFHEIQATYDEKTRTFNLAPDALPLPRFPIEGIYTRNCIGGRSQDSKYEMKFLETSSPGLRGQSGGPIFDVNGTVWAIQSRTIHFPLGFSPKVRRDNREIEEHQFLSVGWGVHPEILIAFLRDNNIDFKLSDY